MDQGAVKRFPELRPNRRRAYAERRGQPVEQPATKDSRLSHQPNMEANGNDSIIIAISGKNSKPDRNSKFAEALVCSARCLASALDGASRATLGLYGGDKGEVCLPQLLTLPQRQPGTRGACRLAPEAKFTPLTRAKLAALELLVPGCLAHCCSQLPCLAVNCGSAISPFFFFHLVVLGLQISVKTAA